MKLFYLLILVFMSNIKYSQAQFAVGVNTGINISNLRSNFAQEYFEGKLVSLTFGISPQYSVSDKINIVLNLECSPKGLRQYGLMTDAKYRYTYFDVLPELEYNFSKYLKVGLGINYGKLLDEENNINGQGWRSAKYLDNTNVNDFGLSLKIQGEIKHIYVYLRYNHGLKDLTDTTLFGSDGEFVQEINYYNRNIQIGLGYLIEKMKINTATIIR